MGFLRTFQKIKTRQLQDDATAPKKGDWAPEFSLEELDGKSLIRLSDYRGKKPVVLVFGSHT
jgi:hypothetical protein